MTATLPEQASLRAMLIDDLGALYRDTHDDDVRAAVLAEAARRDRADRAREARRAVAAEWYDAMFAQYLAAEAECRGVLLSSAGLASVADPISLWRGSERWARRMASEELRNFWDDHGGRLSLATWQRQLAAAKRAERDERDLAAMDAAEAADTVPGPGQAWERVPGGAVREASVPVGSLTVAAWTAMDTSGTITLHPSRARATAWLAPEPEPEPAPAPPPPAPVVAPGAAARYMAALTALADHTDTTAARIAAARSQITNGVQR